MKPIVLFILIGILVLLATGGIVLGATRADSGTAGFPPDWVTGMADLLVPQQRLRVGDVSLATPQDCQGQWQRGAFVLPAGSTCTLLIKPASRSVRQFSLELSAGNAASVVLVPRRENSVTETYALPDKQGRTTVKISILEEGGRLDLTCLGGIAGESCTLNVR